LREGEFEDALVGGEEGLERLRSVYLRRAVLWTLPLAALAVAVALLLDLRSFGRVVSPVDRLGLPLLFLGFLGGFLWVWRRPEHAVPVARGLFGVYALYLLFAFGHQVFVYFPQTGHFSEVAYWVYVAVPGAFLLFPRRAAFGLAVGLFSALSLLALGYHLRLGLTPGNPVVQFFAALAVLVGLVALLAMNDVWLSRVRVLARTDGLTGLVNRRALQALLEPAVRRAHAGGTPLAVVLFDLDDFKRINDRYGHWSGDRVLRALAQGLKGVLRRGDTLGRWGGEEFLVVLEDAGPGEARALANRLCARVKALAPLGVPLSASFGVAVLRPGEDAESLVARADRAMYRAKAAGKGRVELSA